MFRWIRKEQKKKRLKNKAKLPEEKSNKQEVAPIQQQQHSEEVPTEESTPSQPLSKPPQSASESLSSSRTMLQAPVVTTYPKPSTGPTIIPPSPTSTATTASESTAASTSRSNGGGSSGDYNRQEILKLENLPVEKFLISFRENGSECISSAYL